MGEVQAGGAVQNAQTEKRERLSLNKIRLDGGTQMRAQLSDDKIADYAEAMREGVTFAPVSVCYDGTEYWLWDGFHRYRSAEKVGFEEIDADVRPGARRDAILLAAGANALHGLPRTSEDKRRSVMALLQDEEWGKWSDREISRRAGVSDRFVNNMRDRVTANGSQSERTYVTKHGTVATMNTAEIGKRGGAASSTAERAGSGSPTNEAAPFSPAELALLDSLKITTQRDRRELGTKPEIVREAIFWHLRRVASWGSSTRGVSAIRYAEDEVRKELRSSALKLSRNLFASIGVLRDHYGKHNFGDLRQAVNEVQDAAWGTASDRERATIKGTLLQCAREIRAFYTQDEWKTITEQYWPLPKAGEPPATIEECRWWVLDKARTYARAKAAVKAVPASSKDYRLDYLREIQRMAEEDLKRGAEVLLNLSANEADDVFDEPEPRIESLANAARELRWAGKNGPQDLFIEPYEQCIKCVETTREKLIALYACDPDEE